MHGQVRRPDPRTLLRRRQRQDFQQFGGDEPRETVCRVQVAGRGGLLVSKLGKESLTDYDPFDAGWGCLEPELGCWGGRRELRAEPLGLFHSPPKGCRTSRRNLAPLLWSINGLRAMRDLPQFAGSEPIWPNEPTLATLRACHVEAFPVSTADAATNSIDCGFSTR